jgi:hypothetical protein
MSALSLSGGDPPRAFSSQVETPDDSENAIKQELRAQVLIPSKPNALYALGYKPQNVDYWRPPSSATQALRQRADRLFRYA